MKILLNNRSEDLDAQELNVTELLKLKNFTWKMLVVRVNGKVVRKHEYDSVTISDGDEVTVLHLVTGG